MLKKWLIASGLAMAVGVLIAGADLVSQRAVLARPSDNAKDVRKGEKPVEGKIVSGSRARQWREKSDQTVTIEFEPNTPLREALSHIAERYKMTIIVDTEAFKADQNQPDVEGQPVKLMRLPDVKILTALRAIFEQINGDFYTKDDVLTVVPRSYIEGGRVFRHPVDVIFSKRPLADALSELSDLSGLSIVLDPRAQADASPAVTANFSNVPVHDAVRVLADVSGMKSVAMNNLLYVTSIQNADKLEKEKAQKDAGATTKSEKVMPQEGK